MGLHRYCILLAVASLLLVLVGALVTSDRAGLAVPGWPLPSGGARGPEALIQQAHRTLGAVVGVLTLALLVWLWRVERRRWLRWLGVGALLLVALQGLLGGLTVLYGLPGSLSILHACAAQLFFSLAVTLAWASSRSWDAAALSLEDSGRPSLRRLALATPVGVLAQVALGAAYRHGAMGIMPHIIGAVVVTGLVVLISVIVLTQFADRQPVAKPAKRLLVITLHQVVLGVLAYVLSIITDGAGSFRLLALTATVAHVGVGALTMAASVILTIQIWRSVHSQEAVV